MHIEDFDSGRNLVHTRSADVSYVDIGPGAGSGEGAGAPALFIHGVGTNAYLWRNVIAELRNERRCIALDLPTHGQSPARADQDLSLGALATAVADFCDALGLDDIDLVANDTGGAIAQIFAANNAHRLRSFTLTNCETHDNVPPEAFKPTVELAQAGLLAPSAAGLLEDLSVARVAVFGMGYEDPEQPDLDTVRAFLEPVLGTPERALQFERMLAGLNPTDLLAAEPALAALNVPTLVVWGTGDAFFDVRWAYWLRDTIPGVTEVVEISGAKLFFPDERGAELAAHLRRHWSAVRPNVAAR